jgi:TolB-like protein
METPGNVAGDAVDSGRRAEVLLYLKKLLSGKSFASSRRRAELLRYLVERMLAGKADSISEYGIGLDVYGKPDSFDPRLDSTVRSDMSRLRRTLAEYYEREGAADAWRIEFPNRGYLPGIAAVERPAGPQAVRTVPARPETPSRRVAAWWVVSGAALVLCGFAVWTVQPMRGAARSVVVLPFENLTGDPKAAYLTDGITEKLTDALAEVPSLRVVARTSAFQFKGKGIDVREIGRKLDVELVVEGSLQKSDRGYLLTVQINRSDNGYHLLSRTFQGSTSELPRLERDMVQPLLAVMRPGTAMAQRHIPDPEAYDLYLRASSQKDGRPESYEAAISYLSQAIQRDSRFADAYALLGQEYAGMAVNVAPHPLEPVPLAKAAARKALEMDPLSSGAWAAEGFADAFVLLDWKLGEQELRKAIELAPGSAKYHNWLGSMLMTQGRFAEAEAELRLGDSMDPLNPAPTVARMLYMARRYDESLEECGRMLRLHPDVQVIHIMIGNAWEAKGFYDKALAEYQAFNAKAPDSMFFQANVGHLYAVSGKRQKALEMIAALEHPQRGAGEPRGWDLALIYAALNDRDQALEWLDRAFEQRHVWFLKVDPRLDPLRSDPRYEALLRKAGLAGVNGQ